MFHVHHIDTEYDQSLTHWNKDQAAEGFCTAGTISVLFRRRCHDKLSYLCLTGKTPSGMFKVRTLI